MTCCVEQLIVGVTASECGCECECESSLVGYLLSNILVVIVTPSLFFSHFLFLWTSNQGLTKSLTKSGSFMFKKKKLKSIAHQIYVSFLNVFSVSHSLSHTIYRSLINIYSPISQHEKHAKQSCYISFIK